MSADVKILEELYEVLQTRKTADPEESYTARLYQRGVIKIAQKVGEEGVETALAAVAQDKRALLTESADLLYMLLVLWAAKDVKPKEVWAVLDERFGVPGVKDKDKSKGRDRGIGDG